ncbi:ABC transporter ATP-binding protein [Sulfolobales archaeon HS-7]|nr:ABC transporter ATP-binding protein [Sulfolobales archaeon HS-7]
MLLKAKDLTVYYSTIIGKTKILDSLNLNIEKGELVGIVGESGSGKSTLGFAVAGLMPPNAEVKGNLEIEGKDVVGMKEKELQQLRGTEVFMIFQNPLNSLNPVKTVGFQLLEAVRVREERKKLKYNEEKAVQEVIEVLKELRFPDPERILSRYPHQLSGGQVQRIVIAMALLLKPKLLIADEPTSALDVTIQAQVISLIRQLNQEYGIALIFITHDIALANVVSDRLIVMYAGRLMEDGPTDKILKNPLHPYTAGLISSIPKIRKEDGELPSIRGAPPSFLVLPKGCKFSPRCAKVMQVCKEREPSEIEVEGRKVRCWLYG